VNASVKIHFIDAVTSCAPRRPVEGQIATFAFVLENAPYGQGYTALWNTSGASAAQGQGNSSTKFSVIAPAESVLATVSVTIVFDDGSTANGSYSFYSESQEVAVWQYFLCKLKQERPIPIPWWQWDPEKVRNVAAQYSPMELRVISERMERVLQTLNVLGERSRVDVPGDGSLITARETTIA